MISGQGLRREVEVFYSSTIQFNLELSRNNKNCTKYKCGVTPLVWEIIQFYVI